MNRVVRGSTEWAEEIMDNGHITRREVKTTMESISGSWFLGHALKYGDYVIHVRTDFVCTYRSNRSVVSVYKFNDSRKEIDSEIEILWIGDSYFEDEGHAVAAGMRWIEKEGK